MVSYSLNHEDVLLNRVFAGKTRGFYLDVGANHPIHSSLTKHFYDLGWRGINIEPNPIFVQELQAYRPQDVNLAVGVADVRGRIVFFNVLEDPGLSTFSREVAEQHRREGFTVSEKQVDVTTLVDVCSNYAQDVVIDFLKVDVEGYEYQVLAGADFRRFRPRLMVIEATRPNSNELVHQGWEQLLLNADYRFAFFDGCNRYYLRSEDVNLLPLLSYPVNFLDRYVSIEQYNLEEKEKVFEPFGRVALATARIVQGIVSLTRVFRPSPGLVHTKRQSLEKQK